MAKLNSKTKKSVKPKTGKSKGKASTSSSSTSRRAAAATVDSDGDGGVDSSNSTTRCSPTEFDGYAVLHVRHAPEERQKKPHPLLVKKSDNSGGDTLLVTHLAQWTDAYLAEVFKLFGEVAKVTTKRLNQDET